ncbi:MAG: T9SS type A sorting domain-containing protein, partial [Bacteroidetes bacterium]|nr:T9SS type A sorting domain-containing protein [Bacteroidota bacterium]
LENNIASLSVYPNPVKDDLVLEMEKGQKGSVIIKLMNMLGQTVMERSLEVNSGKWTYKLPVSKLPAGVYTVTVQSENSFVSRQIIKE